MEIESLTPEERIEIQMHYLRSYYARKRRSEFDERRRAVDEQWARTKRYDVSGRLIGIGNETCAPRMTSRQEDRAPVDYEVMTHGRAEIHAVERRVDERSVHDGQPGGRVQT